MLSCATQKNHWFGEAEGMVVAGLEGDAGLPIIDLPPEVDTPEAAVRFLVAALIRAGYSFTDRTNCPFPISCVSRGWTPPTGVRS
jgi:hypothetical protein